MCVYAHVYIYIYYIHVVIVCIYIYEFHVDVKVRDKDSIFALGCEGAGTAGALLPKRPFRGFLASVAL